MINRNSIFSALVVAALFALPAIVHSYDLIDLENDSNLESTDVGGQCSTANIGNIVSKFNTQYEKQLVAQAKQEFVNSFKNFAQQWMMCIVGSILAQGTGVSGAKSCTTTVGNSTLTALRDQYERNYKDELVTDCTAQSDIRGILNAARRILSENGRDGGPVYVRDWRAFKADNRYRGLQIARNEMANTNHCSWVSGPLQGAFNFNPANAAPPMSGNEDGRNSYIRDAGCSLGDDFNPAAPQFQTTQAFAAMMLPQNNIGGSYLLAQEEITRQIANEEEAAQNEFVPTGGVGALRAINPATGNSCAVMAADGSTCLQYSGIEQPAAGVVAGINAGQQAQFDLITNPRTTAKVASDVRASLIGAYLSMNQPLARLQYRRDPAEDNATPTPGPVPGSGDENDPVCTGGNPDCQCAINNTSQQELARGVVLSATRTTIQQHPEMVTPDGVSVRQGQNVPFLQAVCNTSPLSGVGGCRPNNAGFGLVIAVEPIEINVDVILPNNVIRQPGVVTTVCTTPGNL